MVRVRHPKEKAGRELVPQENDKVKPRQAPDLDYNVGNWFSEMSKFQDLRDWKALAIIFGFIVFIRLATGLGPYSGFNDSPTFGDYEAQRHWLEITHHLPLAQWYFHDLHYWGLDYPPLTAFHSKLLGFIGNVVNPSYVELYASRGLESPDSKVFMRLTALVSDILVFFSGGLYFAWPSKKGPTITKIAGLALLLINPCFTLIDHGHFQYNCVMLGFALWAFALLSSGRRLLGAFAFCMALGFKQMALFYALPVFFFLVGQIVYSGFLKGTILLIKVGVTTVLSLGALLVPFAYAGHQELKDFGMAQLMQIFHRLFPVGRGLYEDKVANFWCGINVAVKLRSMYSVALLARVSAITTFMVLLPSCLHLLKTRTQPSFIYSLAISALAFFLFGFQVHEKTILLPLLPLALLNICEVEGVWLVRWFTNIAAFSMHPLLFREGLVSIYWSNLMLWNVLSGPSTSYPSSFLGWIELASTLGALLLHALEAFTSPPARYPDIFTVATILYAAPHFLATLAYLNWRQFRQPRDPRVHLKEN